MRISSISILSIKRKKLKTLFFAFGMIISVTAVVTLMKITTEMKRNIDEKLDSFGANIIITPKNDRLALNYGGMSFGEVSYSSELLKLKDIEKLDSIKNRKNLSVISPKLLDVVTINSSKVLIGGVDFNNELKIKKWWKINGKSPTDDNEILIGWGVKEKFKFNIKDVIKLKGENFIVSGFLDKTGSQDDDIIFGKLNKVQDLFNYHDKISMVELSALCYDCPIEDIVTQASDKLPNAKVTPVMQTINSKMQAVNGFEKFSYGVSLTIILVCSLVVFLNVNSSLNERVKEIGIFKAVGFTRFNILNLIMLEIVIISVVSGVVGFIFGTLIAKKSLALLGVVSEINLWDLNLFLLATILSVFIGTMASLLPTLKAIKLDPTVAFRNL